ncbi:NAD(P)-dependent oxidoreductase [Kribbella sp. NBC_01245]|uniref:NAD-dependent epimerase/dehydratase family protein n=1 Tax=Kribbella sp. NBC_01245 TaxID=2903578 RepID=UPI002E2E4766|nr:NAD(P)-dependent oxidoreductase [Kribbella sp. NBC_01245]
MTIAITGAAGQVSTLIRPLLRVPDRVLRLSDISVVSDLAAGEEFVQASVTDLDAMTSFFEGADLVVHLGGHKSERPWRDILETNINGSHVVLEAARRAGVQRVLLGSSIHAVGFVRAADAAAAPVLPPRPDTYYGVGKVAMEALGSLYADRFGMSVVSARICTVGADIGTGGRTLSTWVSPGDLARLVEATAALDHPGHHIVWGVSANTRTWFSPEAGLAIGFKAHDNAEHHITPTTDVQPPNPTDLLAGAFTGDPTRPLGGTW